jgi:hypothetical protein
VASHLSDFVQGRHNLGSHWTAIEQVIETANAVPPVTIWFEENAVFVPSHRLTVVFG